MTCLFNIIVVHVDIIGFLWQGPIPFLIWYIKLCYRGLVCMFILPSSEVDSVKYDDFDFFWRCYVDILCVIGLMLFWRFYDEKWWWLYHHEKAWVINWTSSFFIVACQVLWWYCWFYGWFEGIMWSMLIYHLMCC